MYHRKIFLNVLVISFVIISFLTATSCSENISVDSSVEDKSAITHQTRINNDGKIYKGISQRMSDKELEERNKQFKHTFPERQLFAKVSLEKFYLDLELDLNDIEQVIVNKEYVFYRAGKNVYKISFFTKRDSYSGDYDEYKVEEICSNAKKISKDLILTLSNEVLDISSMKIIDTEAQDVFDGSYLKSNVLYNKKNRVIKNDCNNVISFSSSDNNSVFITNEGIFEFDNKIFDKVEKVKTKLDINKIIKIKDMFWAIDKNNILYCWGTMVYGKKEVLVSSKSPLIVSDNVSNISCAEISDENNTGIQLINLNNRMYDVSLSLPLKQETDNLSCSLKLVDEGCNKIFNYGFINNENKVLIKRNFSSKIQISGDDFQKYDKWWISAEIYNKEFYSNEAYCINKNVKKISGAYYQKGNHWYEFTKTGDTKRMPGNNIVNMWQLDTGYCCLDTNNNIWYNGPKNASGIYYPFYYLKDSKLSGNNLVEKNVDRFWANRYGTAIVKDGKLYVHGTLELLQDPEWWAKDEDQYEDYYDYPPYNVEYRGIDTNNISNISFGIDKMYVVMKDGEAFYIKPNDRRKSHYMKYSHSMYPAVRTITEKDKKQKNKNVEYYSDYGILYKNNELKGKLIFDFELKDVKKIVKGGDANNMCFALMDNGNLYGWGYNAYQTICNNDEQFIDFENRVLIATDIKDVSTTKDFGVFYLNKAGQLNFRGFNSWDVKSFAY